MDSPDCPGCLARDGIIAALQQRMAEHEQHVGLLQRRVEQLEARLKINSSNSSTPPPADPPSVPRPPSKPPSGRKPGGQPGHAAHRRALLAAGRVSHWVHHRPGECEHCHAPLPQNGSADDPSPTRHQVIDLPPQMAEVTEHQGHACTCPNCGPMTRAAIPAEVLAHGFGPRLTAFIAFLSGRCHDSKRTIEEVVETLLDVPIALGSIPNAEQQMAAPGGAGPSL